MLIVSVKNRKTGRFKNYQFSQKAVLFGRQDTNDVVLESSSISRRHAKITLNNDAIEIEDLGSGNGTIVNQEKIATKEKHLIKISDKIRIEEFDIRLQLKDIKDTMSPDDLANKTAPDLPANTPSTKPEPGSFENTDPDILEIKMIKKVLGALDHDKLPSLTILSKPFENKKAVFESTQDALIIGRDPDCHLTLDSNIISRRHAEITIKWGHHVVKDLDSKNGVFVNGERVSEKSISDGDEIMLGTIKAIFKNPQEFDLAAISDSIEKEKHATQKPEPAPEPKPEPKDKNPVSEENLDELLDTKAPQDNTGETATPAKENPLTNILDKLTPHTTKLLKLLKGFSPTEMILLGFGLLVVVIVVSVLVSLLQ